MKINWKVRVMKKSFWLSIIPALLVLTQMVLNWFGVDFAVELVQQEATKFINAVFMVFSILGIVVDPTTKGVSDSQQARTYKKPRGDVE